MKRFSLLHLLSAFACSVAILPLLAQEVPTIPPSQNPKFWGTANDPYILSETLTSATTTQAVQRKIYRDSAGHVREEGFYNSGKLMSLLLRNPGGDSLTTCNVVPKTCMAVPSPAPRAGNAWKVERLGPRVIAGIEAEGLRFTRATAASPDGKIPAATLVEDDWISNELGVVLEQTINNGRGGNSTKTVTELQKIEPDQSLFKVPEGYAMLQPAH